MTALGARDDRRGGVAGGRLQLAPAQAIFAVGADEDLAVQGPGSRSGACPGGRRPPCPCSRWCTGRSAPRRRRLPRLRRRRCRHDSRLRSQRQSLKRTAGREPRAWISMLTRTCHRPRRATSLTAGLRAIGRREMLQSWRSLRRSVAEVSPCSWCMSALRPTANSVARDPARHRRGMRYLKSRFSYDEVLASPLPETGGSQTCRMI